MSLFVERREFAAAKRPAMNLYHSEVFLPYGAKEAASRLVFQTLRWTRHAQLELYHDRYGRLPAHQVPKCFFGVAWQLIELETSDGEPTKYVFRRSAGGDRDLIIVLRPLDNGEAVVVTCWTNLKTDRHATLDRSKYAAA